MYYLQHAVRTACGETEGTYGLRFLPMPYLTVVDLIKASWLRLNYWCKTNQTYLGTHTCLHGQGSRCTCVCVGDACTWYVRTLPSLTDAKGKIQGKRWQSLNHREKRDWAKAKIMKKKEGKLEHRIKGGNEKLTVHIAEG